MDLAFAEEQELRRIRREAKSSQNISKHSVEDEAESSADAMKRVKSEVISSGVDVDVTSIPVELVIELVMASLGSVSIEHLQWAFDVSHTPWHG